MTTQSTTGPSELAAATQRARAVWSMGDFARLGAEQVIVGERLATGTDIRPTERVLDVAAGSGNAALAAARRGADVVATDFVESLLETAARRADAEGLTLTTEVADAQALPYDDGSFDVVISTFGVIFAPDQQRAADEMLRVCRPGGRIALTAWTPGGLMAAIQADTARHLPVPSAPGMRSPIEWGTEARVRELFGDRATDTRFRLGSTDVCAVSPQARVAFLRQYMGPTVAAFAQLDEPGRDALAYDLAAGLERFNRAEDGTLVATAEYLEVIVTRA